VASALGMSGRTVSRHVKEATGLNFGHYLRRCRIEAAACLLRDNARSISEAAYEVGYETPQHFARAFRQERGMSPTEYRKSRHRGHNDATRDAGD